ncbi:MAG: hypothetical protein GXX96_18795 [Planctomycetaceae bacterium]|nr:hypothetical protein [Planctomycetaceae bacterium]
MVLESAPGIPILLIYDIDPTWTSREREDAHRDCRRVGFAMRRHGHSVSFLPVCDPDLSAALSEYDPQDVLVFNWCESIPGITRSEVTVAETLERLCFTYTGASPEALELSYEKARVKEILESHGVPTPRWKLFDSPREGGWSCFPAIVKPAREHCSHGVDPGAVVTGASELRDRVAYVVDTFQQPALVEDFIDGREFHVPLWGNEHVELLPPVEMDFSAFDDIHNRLCSCDAKFVPQSEAYRRIKSFVPARLTEKEMAEIETTAKITYEAIGCRDYGRIDIRLRDGVFYVLDVNPNADISSDASLALSASKAGYSYGAMASRILRLAARRHCQNLAPHQ